MEVLCEGESRRLFLFHLLQSFFHESASDFQVKAEIRQDAARVVLKKGSRSSEGIALITTSVHFEKKRSEHAALGLAFGNAASAFSDYRPPYGTLTGVRPVKVPLYYLDRGKSKQEVTALLTDHFLVSENKANLLVDLAQTEQTFRQDLSKKHAVLYVSIPFCPSRCSYCSFISSAAERYLKLIPSYLEQLCWELKETAQLLSGRQIKILAVYVGGGTPGVLSESELHILLQEIRGLFDLSHCNEFCVEIGRPDTVTYEKLRVAEKFGVDRISINPQTTCNDTLQRIGRKHSASDFFHAMGMAKDFPFAINCDLISALPGETPDIFLRSVEEVLALQPKNLTIHALCRKKSASNSQEPISDINFVKAVEKAYHLCINRNLKPYYLYRQKMSADDLENLGFAEEGFLGVYNLAMMEDLCDVFACGAGGIGKLISWESNGKIQRFAGFKYPFEYLNQPEKVKERLSRLQDSMERRDYGPINLPEKHNGFSQSFD